jgi:hypothetical protein
MHAGDAGFGVHEPTDFRKEIIFFSPILYLLLFYAIMYHSNLHQHDISVA